MIADTSALLAIVFGEPDAERHRDAMSGATVRLSAVSLVEATIVAESRHGPEGARSLSSLLHVLSVVTEPVDAEQTREAIVAWRRFGKGRHVAALNFGDCFAYALARVRGEPLLFKGDDFAQTDIASVLN